MLAAIPLAGLSQDAALLVRQRIGAGNRDFRQDSIDFVLELLLG
jgi:hypothetical protein